ncbi:MAG: hypothetical protein V3V47_03345 [Desulfobacteria bacterium]
MAGYGLRPVGSGGGMGNGYNTGGFSEYRIDVSAVAAGATVIYSGDFVELTSTGEIDRQAGNTTGETPTTANGVRTLGVAVGFRWKLASGEQKYGQYYPSVSTDTDAYAFVCDDPNQVYLIQSDGATTYADIGSNAPVVNFATASGSTITGNSGIQLDHSGINTTNTLALRILGVPEDGSNESSSTPNVLVKLNDGVSQFSNPLGV